MRNWRLKDHSQFCAKKDGIGYKKGDIFERFNKNPSNVWAELKPIAESGMWFAKKDGSHFMVDVLISENIILDERYFKELK